MGWNSIKNCLIQHTLLTIDVGGGSHIIVPNIYSIIDLNKITVLFNTYSYLLNCGGVTFFTFYLLYWGSDIVPSIVLQI